MLFVLLYKGGLAKITVEAGWATSVGATSVGGKTQAPKYLIKGEHRWQWDGYDNEDIFLDTAN